MTITTPEQMREAAIDACKKVADEAKSYGIPQMTMGANTCYDAIRAIPIAPQPVAVAVKPLDLSNALKHAFIAGRISSGGSSSFHSAAWTEYDPAESAGYARILSALTIQPADPRHELAVWYGKMPESNGKENWTASLYRKTGDAHMDGFCFARSEYADRVRYEADRVRWIIGDLAEKPHILDYDADLHSGYIHPAADPMSDPRVVALVKAARKVMSTAELREAYHRLPNDKNRIGAPKSPKCKARDAWLKSFRRACSATEAALRAIGGEA